MKYNPITNTYLYHNKYNKTNYSYHTSIISTYKNPYNIYKYNKYKYKQKSFNISTSYSNKYNKYLF